MVDGARRWVHANTNNLAFGKRYQSQVMVGRYEDLVPFPDRELEGTRITWTCRHSVPVP